jgi:RNase P subunit RPR2
VNSYWLLLFAVVPPLLIYLLALFVIYNTIGVSRKEWRRKYFEAQTNCAAAVEWGGAMQRDKKIAEIDLAQASHMLHVVMTTQSITCSECYKPIVPNGNVTECVIRNLPRPAVLCTQCMGDTSDMGVYRSWPRF